MKFEPAAEPAPGSTTSGPPRRRRRKANPLDRRRLPLLLRRAWYGLNQAFRRVTTQAGITPDQFTVLRNLCELDPEQITQCQLAERMSSDANTVASLLRRMEVQGLVERLTHPNDGRAHCLALRPAGRRKFIEVRRLALGLQKTVLAALPKDEREPFLARLELVAGACWEASQNHRARPVRKRTLTARPAPAG
jgi:DNA-binding MarR family transcriptional regulator